MKKFFSILAVALMATAIVSCNKDEDNSSSAGGNSGGSNIAANTLVYDGITYVFDEVNVDYYHSALTLMSASTSDTLEDGSPRLMVDGIHITPNMWNREFDLTSQAEWPDEVSVYLYLSGTLDFNFDGWCNGDRDMSGYLDGVDYEHSSIFSSGTYRVSGNNDGTPITVTVDGVLKNGKSFKMKIVSGSYLSR